MTGRKQSRKRGRVTLADVALAAGVSPATVSNAYNRHDQLSAELRARILETAHDLGYPGPDPAARSLRRGSVGAVAVLYSEYLSYAFLDPAAGHFLQGVARAMDEAGLGMLLIPHADGRSPVVSRAVVDGFILRSMPEDDAQVTEALARGLPTVVVDGPERAGLPFIGIDVEAAARGVAKHLLDLGHRRIAVVSFPLTSTPRSGPADLDLQRGATVRATRDRLSGYARALEEAGLSWSEVPVYECAHNSPEDGADAARVLLGHDPRPTAMLAASDQLAFGVIRAARALGLKVPHDLSVVGFDDVGPSEELGLTTVRQSHFDKGLQAGRALIALMRGEEVEPRSLLPTELVVRGSTARPREG